MSITKRLSDFVKGLSGSSKAGTPNTYPTGIGLPLWGMTGAEMVEKVPFQYMDFERIEFYYLMSDILRTTVKAVIDETFRNGVEIVKAYEYKCENCGAEFNYKPEACPYCGGTEFRQPDMAQRRKLEEWLSKRNSTGMNLMQVMEALDYDLNIFDNAFLVVLKNYYFNDDGTISKTEPVEITVADPKNMRLIISRDGRLGYDDNGNELWFCPDPEHRGQLHRIRPEERGQEKPRCPICGKVMLRADYAWRSWGYNWSPNDEVLYYSRDEVLHVKKWYRRPGYGVSPIYTLLFKVRTLLRMDIYMMKGYEFERPPLGILILKGNRELINQAVRDMNEEIKRNPATIPVLVIESYDKTPDKIAEYIDLGFHPQEWDLIQLRKEFRRAISALYGVAPVFYEVEYGRKMDATTGMIVTNRAIEAEHKIFNETVFPWLLKQLGITDWRLQFKKPELRDDKTRLEIQEREVRIANAMVKLCYKPKLVKTSDGFTFTYEEDPECRSKGDAEKELTLHQGGDEDPEKKRIRELKRYYEENPPGPSSRERKDDQRFQGEPEIPVVGGVVA